MEKFLSDSHSSVEKSSSNWITIDVRGSFLVLCYETHPSPQQSRAFAQLLHSMSSSPLMATMGPLSKLTARSLTLLANKAEKGLSAIEEAFNILEAMVASLETDWSSSPLAGVQENDIGDAQR